MPIKRRRFQTSVVPGRLYLVVGLMFSLLASNVHAESNLLLEAKTSVLRGATGPLIEVGSRSFHVRRGYHSFGVAWALDRWAVGVFYDKATIGSSAFDLFLRDMTSVLDEHRFGLSVERNWLLSDNHRVYLRGRAGLLRGAWRATYDTFDERSHGFLRGNVQGSTLGYFTSMESGMRFQLFKTEHTQHYVTVSASIDAIAERIRLGENEAGKGPVVAYDAYRKYGNVLLHTGYAVDF